MIKYIITYHFIRSLHMIVREIYDIDDLLRSGEIVETVEAVVDDAFVYPGLCPSFSLRFDSGAGEYGKCQCKDADDAFLCHCYVVFLNFQEHFLSVQEIQEQPDYQDVGCVVDDGVPRSLAHA